MKVDEILNEGPLDYMRGAARYAGDKIAAKMAEKGRQIIEPFEKAHAAGKAASAEADTRRSIAQAKAAIPKLIAKMGANGEEIKRVRDQLKGIPVREGLWDYLRGAGSAAGGAAKKVGSAVGQAGRQVGSAIKGAAQDVGGAVKGAAQQVHQTGQKSSLEGNYRSLTQQQVQLAKQLAQAATTLGISKEAILATINQQLGIKTAGAYWTRSAFVTAFDTQSSQKQASTQQPTQSTPTKQRVEPRMSSADWTVG